MVRKFNRFFFTFFSVTFLVALQLPANTWKSTSQGNSATLTAVWYESKPFVFKTESGKMAGIEPEILEGFQHFLKSKYGISLDIKWLEAESFGHILNNVKNEKSANTIGVSAFSVTDERKQFVKFTKPYAADVSVLICSKNVPVVKTPQAFDSVFNQLTAITIKKTAFETDLIRLKAERNLAFEIQHIPSHSNILKHLLVTPDAFGYIDLPIYLLYYSQNPSIAINRQNLFPIYREGYTFIMPTHSDWDKPFNEFFASPFYYAIKYKAIGKYIDVELFKFFEKLSQKFNEEVALLTKEKELQYEELMGKTRQIQREEQAKYLLLVISVVALVLLIALLILYRKVFNDNLLLKEQKEEIEIQRQSITRQNTELENRNQQLLLLNDEKNNLINMVAHDLRTPIHQIQGFAQLLQLQDTHVYSPTQLQYIKYIHDSSVRLNKMISKMLDVDAIENNRVNYFPERVWLNEFVPPIIDTFQISAAKKNIAITYYATPERLLVWLDPALLTQVLENVLSNAIKFSYPDTNITVELLQLASKAQLKISDEGQGFSAKDLQQIFQKFQPLSAKPTAGEHSTGLGLSIVKKFMDIMGGDIHIESAVGKGTTFFLTFDMLH